MYILGGFDGTRLNDMHLIAFPKKTIKIIMKSSIMSQTQSDNFDETELSVQNVTDIDEDVQVKYLKK